MFDLLGYGQSEQREGQDLTLVAQGRRLAELLRYWNLDRPSVVACDKRDKGLDDLACAHLFARRVIDEVVARTHSSQWRFLPWAS